MQIMLDIRLSRGRDNIKNYGEEKNFKKIFGFSCFMFFLKFKTAFGQRTIIY